MASSFIGNRLGLGVKPREPRQGEGFFGDALKAVAHGGVDFVGNRLGLGVKPRRQKGKGFSGDAAKGLAHGGVDFIDVIYDLGVHLPPPVHERAQMRTRHLQPGSRNSKKGTGLVLSSELTPEERQTHLDSLSDTSINAHFQGKKQKRNTRFLWWRVCERRTKAAEEEHCLHPESAEPSSARIALDAAVQSVVFRSLRLPSDEGNGAES